MDADCIPVRTHGTAKARAGEDDGELTGAAECRIQARCVAPSRSRRPASRRIGITTELAMAKAAEIRGPAGDWHALRTNADYKAGWRAHGGAPSVVEAAGFALRAQTEADLEAARWGLLVWEEPRREASSGRSGSTRRC